MYVCMYVCMYLSVCLSVWLVVGRSVCLSTCLPACLPLSLSLSLSVGRSVSRPARLPACLPIYISNYTIHPSIDRSIYLSFEWLPPVPQRLDHTLSSLCSSAVSGHRPEYLSKHRNIMIYTTSLVARLLLPLARHQSRSFIQDQDKRTKLFLV